MVRAYQVAAVGDGRAAPQPGRGFHECRRGMRLSCHSTPSRQRHHLCIGSEHSAELPLKRFKRAVSRDLLRALRPQGKAVETSCRTAVRASSWHACGSHTRFSEAFKSAADHVDDGVDLRWTAFGPLQDTAADVRKRRSRLGWHARPSGRVTKVSTGHPVRGARRRSRPTLASRTNCERRLVRLTL